MEHGPQETQIWLTAITSKKLESDTLTPKLQKK